VFFFNGVQRFLAIAGCDDTIPFKGQREIHHLEGVRGIFYNQ